MSGVPMRRMVMHIVRSISVAVVIAVAQVSGARAAEEPATCDPNIDVKRISFEQMDLAKCQTLCLDQKRGWASYQCRDRPPDVATKCFQGIKNCHQGQAQFNKSDCNPTVIDPPGAAQCNLTASAEAWTDNPKLT